jgi:pimeloyl-ACP methyl ester carboxylesterase
MLLEIQGHSLNVEDRGSQASPAVILLHHGLGSAAAWRQQLPALVDAGWRAIAYDRWGYGHSDFRASIDMPAFTQDQADLLRLLDRLELGQVSLVGHSDGGTIALYFAAAHPERVHRLVTVAAHVYVEDKMQPSILAVRRDFEQDTRFRSGLRRVHGEKFEQVFHNWFDGWAREACLGWDMRPQLTAIPCPVLVVQGEDDEHAAPQHAIDIAAGIPGAELWLVPGARHMLPQDNAQVFNQRLIEFLGRCDRKDGLANERSE